jgi:SAM-dependent methyltransferase
MLRFDDEETARHLEAVYTTPDIVGQRRAVRAALALRPGERVLDIGCGRGFLAAEMAAEVGPDGRVHAVDPSESMLAITRRRRPAPHSAPLAIETGDALSLPLADGDLDAGAGTLDLVARFVAGRGGVTVAEAQAWAEDARTLGDDAFFSLNGYLFVAVA